jgi:hypothetical protein
VVAKAREGRHLIVSGGTNDDSPVDQRELFGPADGKYQVFD